MTPKRLDLLIGTSLSWVLNYFSEAVEKGDFSSFSVKKIETTTSRWFSQAKESVFGRQKPAARGQAYNVDVDVGEDIVAADKNSSDEENGIVHIS